VFGLRLSAIALRISLQLASAGRLLLLNSHAATITRAVAPRFSRFTSRLYRYSLKLKPDYMPRLHLIFISHYTPQRLCAFILCFVLVPTSASCQANGKNYFPLADGAKWEYTGHASSAGGKQLSFRAATRIDGETLINGKRYFKFIVVSDMSGVPEVGKGIEAVRYYRVAEDGIYVRPGNDPDRPDLLEMPLPIPIGTKWLSGSTEVQAERVGTVKVGDHEYSNCLKLTLRQSDGLRITENYLAPDVGLIKSIYVNNTEPKSTIETTLGKYEP
jgi:hypothetical protein